MKLIIGLGNPGKEYENTRHNAGFMVLDRLAPREGWKNEHQLHANVLKLAHSNQQTVLAKPQTFMNNSGQAVAALLNYYKMPLEDLLVMYDDFDLPLGTIRARQSGSSGGHNGMQSIIDALNTENISRIRIGIGNMQDPDFVEKKIPREDYVLLPFKEAEREIFEQSMSEAVRMVKEMLDNN